MMSSQINYEFTTFSNFVFFNVHVYVHQFIINTIICNASALTIERLCIKNAIGRYVKVRTLSYYYSQHSSQQYYTSIRIVSIADHCLHSLTLGHVNLDQPHHVTWTLHI